MSPSDTRRVASLGHLGPVGEEAQAAEGGEDHVLLFDEGQDPYSAPARGADQGIDFVDPLDQGGPGLASELSKEPGRYTYMPSPFPILSA